MTDVQLSKAYVSLSGLAVGDSFGDRFFVHPDVLENLVSSRALPTAPWRFTDDTEMALSVVSTLRQFGRIDQDSLAASFADKYDGSRGYGPAMHGLLARIREGEDWREAAANLFEGQGSFGNGSAMRVGPLGAYFYEDLALAAEQARLSAVVTHSHPEAVAGAIAIAVAAACAVAINTSRVPGRADFLDRILPYVPESDVKSGIRKGRDLDEDASLQFAVSILGNGTGVSAQDTVPLALWCAGTYLNNFEEAIWFTVSAAGDRDTTCAIVGSIVALVVGESGIPAEWMSSCEPLPEWVYGG